MLLHTAGDRLAHGVAKASLGWRNGAAADFEPSVVGREARYRALIFELPRLESYSTLMRPRLSTSSIRSEKLR